MKMLRLFLVLTLLLQPTVGKSPGLFIRPSQGIVNHDYSKNEKFEPNDLMIIQWETNNANRGFDLVLWQDESKKYEFLSSTSASPSPLLHSLTQHHR